MILILLNKNTNYQLKNEQKNLNYINNIINYLIINNNSFKNKNINYNYYIYIFNTLFQKISFSSNNNIKNNDKLLLILLIVTNEIISNEINFNKFINYELNFNIFFFFKINNLFFNTSCNCLNYALFKSNSKIYTNNTTTHKINYNLIKSTFNKNIRTLISKNYILVDSKHISNKYINNKSSNNITLNNNNIINSNNIFFLRKIKSFIKGRYARIRQNSRVIVYWCLWLNVFSLYSLYFMFYKFTHNWSYIWWLTYIFIILFILSKIIKYNLINYKNIKQILVNYFTSIKLILNNEFLIFTKLFTKIKNFFINN